MAASKKDAVEVFGFSLEIPCESYTPMQQIPKLHVGQRINDTIDSIKDRVHTKSGISAISVMLWVLMALSLLEVM